VWNKSFIIPNIEEEAFQVWRNILRVVATMKGAIQALISAEAALPAREHRM
jgi:hypothetical protein